MSLSIHQACRRGDLDAVRRCVAANPSSVDADDEHHWRPVFHAAIARHLGIVRFLIQSGADLSAHDGYVLHYAGEVPSNKDVVALLLTHGALDAHVRPVSDLQRQFFAAVFLADEFRVRSLMHLHPGLATQADGRGDGPLHHAARHGDAAIVRALIGARLLLGRGADPAAPLSDAGETLREWVGQFPDEPGLVEVATLLDEHADGARVPSGVR